MSDSFSFSNIRIVLVNTSHPGNIGAAARAMKNMGLHKLVLVRPEKFPSSVAVGRAVSALDILDNAIVVDNLAEAIRDCGLVIGTSARQRSIPLKMFWPDECADEVVKAAKGNQVALVFGREDSGLTNQEIQMCHWHVQIPANDDYSSLNLAAAVLLLCYEIRRGFMRDAGQCAPQEQDYWDIARATGEQLEHFYEHLEKVLVRIEFHDPENPRQLMQRMRRMFGRIGIDSMEMNILRGILSHVEYHLDHPKTNEQVAGKNPANKSDKTDGSRKRKDFAAAAQSKRNPETMASILARAGKNDGNTGQ